MRMITVPVFQPRATFPPPPNLPPSSFTFPKPCRLLFPPSPCVTPPEAQSCRCRSRTLWPSSVLSELQIRTSTNFSRRSQKGTALPASHHHHHPAVSRSLLISAFSFSRVAAIHSWCWWHQILTTTRFLCRTKSPTKGTALLPSSFSLMMGSRLPFFHSCLAPHVDLTPLPLFLTNLPLA